MPLEDGLRDFRGFGRVVACEHNLHRNPHSILWSLSPNGEQLVAFKIESRTDRRIAADGFETGTQDRNGGAVVALEHHSAGLRKALEECQEGAARGAAETKDGLVRIAHGKNILLFPTQQRSEFDLRDVGILKLVDQDETRRGLLV